MMKWLDALFAWLLVLLELAHILAIWVPESEACSADHGPQAWWSPSSPWD